MVQAHAVVPKGVCEAVADDELVEEGDAEELGVPLVELEGVFV